MATLAHARAVKSLNKTPGGKRFVFKTFSQRLEDLDINVYRSLEEVKSEPSEGSFFRDCLIEWRELNAAGDFISIYEELMPLTQTLSLVLLHKKLIVTKLLLKLHIKARLSLEPILRLLAALSRDLLEDFLPLLPSIVDSLVSLLESGADREPDIVEQIFTSWSYIMMYLMKYVIYNPVDMFKVTEGLRYYPKEYIQEFMAEAMSILLRNAPDEQQLTKGIKRIMLDVVKEPCPSRKSAVSALIYYVMGGFSSKLHSKAERVLKLLTENSIYCKASDIVLEVVTTVFQRLCEEIVPKELALMWDCIYSEIYECLNTGCNVHLKRMLSLLNSNVQKLNGKRVPDYKKMLELIWLLVQTYIIPSNKGQDDQPQVVDEILLLMLGILDGLCRCNYMSNIIECSLQWAPIFELQNPSLLHFIVELLQKDCSIVYAFKVNVISAISNLMENSEEQVMYLLLRFFEKLQDKAQDPDSIDERSAKAFSKISKYVHWIIYRTINDIQKGDPRVQINERKLAVLWGAICCWSHMSVQANPSLLLDFIDAVDRFLTAKTVCIADIPKEAWESVVGAALSSYSKRNDSNKSGLAETAKFLGLAKRYRSSSPMLSSVACHLDCNYGLALQKEPGYATTGPEVDAEQAKEAASIFSDNLCHANKEIRVSTLRILCHYEPLNFGTTEDGPVMKKRKIDDDKTSCLDSSSSNVLQLLLSVETTPVSISTSRRIILLISRIQMCLYDRKISEILLPLVLNGLIGILHNRFSDIWNPVLECLKVLMSQHGVLVCDKLIHYLEQCQAIFLMSQNNIGSMGATMPDMPSDIVGCFKLFGNPATDSTPCATILSLMLQAFQKNPSVIEPRSQQIVPLFLSFLGYNIGDLVSISRDGLPDTSTVGLFDSHACKGKEWKAVLKEWLNLLKLMQKSKSFCWSLFLKEVLHNRLLDENDPEIQTKVLDCLLTWRDDYLLPYDQHLKNLISSKNLREELTTWSLSRETNIVQESHRACLVPLVIRLLVPKVRKLKGLASRKNASIHHRKAILSFIAQLDVEELPLFFALLIKPLHNVSRKADGATNLFWTTPEILSGEFHASSFLQQFTKDNITDLSLKKRFGLLHVIEDILGVFDYVHVGPFLNVLIGWVVQILGSCASSLDLAKHNGLSSESKDFISTPDVHKEGNESANQIETATDLKQLKDLRSLCLKIVCIILNKYEEHEFGSEFWDLFFASVKSLIDGFKQEGSSSEKPSSLFSCFLAMSRNYRLVPLLYRENSLLIPDIYSILTIKSASESVILSVLKFAENLLSLDNDAADEDNGLRSVLLSYTGALMGSLHCFFGSDNATRRKMVKTPSETVMKIFKILPKYVKDPSLEECLQLAKQFVDILLPFINKRSQSSDVCLSVVQAVRDIIPVLGSTCTAKILKAVSPLLISAELDMRSCICDLLDTLAEADPSVLSVAAHIRKFNETSAMELGELDYDTITNHYKSITSEFFFSVPMDHALLILSHSVHDLSSEESMLRHCAHGLLLSFVDFCSTILFQDGNNCSGMSRAPNIDNDYWSRPCIESITSKFLLKHMGDAMSRAISVKKIVMLREWVDLLRQMVLKLPQVANLKSMESLCSDDVDMDFFNNIIHLQKRMRAKALLHFRNVIGANNMSAGITKKVFVPLFFNMLFDLQEGKDEHVRNACMEALASIAHKMEWNSYYALLIRCFREMTVHPDKQKVLVRLICLVLDKFHFSEISSIPEHKEFVHNVSVSGADTVSSVISVEIQTCLYKVVFPKLQKLLSSDSDKVNAYISLAALKVLKLLSEDVMKFHLSCILHRISNFLKSRLESMRDEARSALVACLKELGLQYLQYVVKVLRMTLKRGYELHVLGYTVNFVLLKCLQSPVPGKLDDCLEDLLSVVQTDILGDVAEEKEVDKIASKMKETRKKKSFETLNIIAQNVTFSSHVPKLLSPITEHLQKHLSPNMKTKLENMLHEIAAGIECNPSLDQTDLFVFIHNLVEDGIKDEKGQNDKKLAVSENKNHQNESSKRIHSRRIITPGSPCSHLITVFALRIFKKRVKSMKLGGRYEHVLSLLDSYVTLLADCLCSKYEDVLSASLGCLTLLVRLPLQSLESHADRVKTALLDIAQSSVNSSSPLMHSCLSLLTEILQRTKITLSLDQLNIVIQFPVFLDLERNPSPVALSLLKGIVNRKLVDVKVYKLMERVADLMVTSQMESVRKKCSQILLQFLLDYHLSEKRLREYLCFLFTNLSYEHSSGREAVLEMLHAIIVKFPKDFVEKQAQTLFLHLVFRLANDIDNNVRSMSGAAIKKLISCTSREFLHPILEYSMCWYLDGKEQLRGAAAQVLGLLVEVMEKEFQDEELLDKILGATHTLLQSAMDAVVDIELDISNESAVPLWKEAYYSLVMLEKILQQFHVLCFERKFEGIWKTISEILLHPHSWLRNRSSQIVSLYFSRVEEACRENKERTLGNYFPMGPNQLFFIAASCCCQLKAQLIDDAARTSITKNLVFAICGVNSLMRKVKCDDPLKFWSALEEHQKVQYLKAFDLLDSRKGRSTFLSLTSSGNDEKDHGNTDGFQYFLVSQVLKKLGKVALEMEDTQMRIVFDSFGYMISKIGQDDCLHYASHVLLPLYKVSEGYAGKLVADNMKQLAQDITEKVRNVLGNQNYVQVYSVIRRNVKDKRNKRKQQEKLMAIVNPVRNAKRKLRIAAKHRAHKKRKMMTMKISRFMRGM